MKPTKAKQVTFHQGVGFTGTVLTSIDADKTGSEITALEQGLVIRYQKDKFVKFVPYTMVHSVTFYPDTSAKDLIGKEAPGAK